jgi:hypothetical protein
MFFINNKIYYNNIMSGIYTPLPVSQLNQLNDVVIDPDTLAGGQVISWDTTDEVWKNTAGGGGGGTIITGANEAVVFKNGSNGDAVSNGISKNTTFAGYTMNLDLVNTRVGINTTAPATRLDVGGNGQFVGTDTLKIENDTLGITTGVNTLKLYSGNTTTLENITEVSSADKSITASSLVSRRPTNFDGPNGIDEGAFYKIKLSRGFNQQPLGHPLWDEQLNFDPIQTQFPTGQQVEYYNTLPRDFARIIARTATGVSITPASVYVITNFGSTFSFQDRCIYDPCMMRSRKTGSGWVFAGAPTQYRDTDIKAMLKVRWYFEGRWASPSANNRLDMYINQFRSGVLLRTFLSGISNNANSCFMSGERLFMGQANYGEDIDWGRDDFQVEIANQGSANISVDLAQVEMEWIRAQ